MIASYNPKIYHIVHIDRLASIVSDGHLWCDAEMVKRDASGTSIGIPEIKERRLNHSLTSHPELLRVGDCVPFYFCPRSVMLYVIHMGEHPKLFYRGGQGPIVHLQADLHTVVQREDRHHRRWAFTTSNAGSGYFEDYANLSQLERIDWDAVRATQWRSKRDAKKAEFLFEMNFSWDLIGRIGVHSSEIRDKVTHIIRSANHKPSVVVVPGWYYW